MKALHKIPLVVLIAGYVLVKIIDNTVYPLKGIPIPDFNNKYDPTML